MNEIKTSDYKCLTNTRNHIVSLIVILICTGFDRFTFFTVGAEFQTELLSFQCFNSCGNSAHAKRRIDVIFTLEHQ